ncbi:MAG: tellurite resistance protein TerC [Actinomycetota bacterium]|nr:tellurite resistance protein TerC [Actinomycetota bacterium]
MDVTITAWAVTVLAVLVLIALDFMVVSSKPHEVGMKEAAGWSVFYIAIAIAWGAGIWAIYGAQYGTEYYTGWLVEKALSVDNLFVFVIILGKFAVPPKYWQKILLFGIMFALIARTIFILLGAAMLEYFSFTFLIFGLLLVWTAVQLARHRDEDPDVEDSKIVEFVQRKLPFTNEWNNGKMTMMENGRRLFTPMLLVMIAIGSTDVLFALDSIPAVYGITSEPYIVFAANAFALLGLRALFFLLNGLLDKMVYLSLGLAIILGFIGVKLILHWAHGVWSWVPEVDTLVSLAVIVVVLIITAIASWLKVRNDPEAIAHAGTVTLSHHPERDQGPHKLPEE